jgi:hypothetical protein
MAAVNARSNIEPFHLKKGAVEMSHFTRACMVLGAVGMAIPSMALAHDVGARYPSRGQCESALAQINTEDRKFLVQIGEFETEGEANRWFHEVFHCEQDEDEWVLVFAPEGQ